MGYLVPYLRRLNRKERYFLVGLALGNREFRLGDGFREQLSDLLGLRVPEDAFVAMDYHLDWLCAAICLAATSGEAGPHPRDPRLIGGTQEDVDLLVAFDDEEESHVVMIEAKGVTAYSNRQFRSKLERLSAVFAMPQARRLVPHFVLVSPARPRYLQHEGCPRWMLDRQGQLAWLPLPIPPGLQKVTRCTADGVPDQRGDFWMVRPE